ncbi:MAG: lipocalin family protein [Proteobacteria bacterium]|nr:lipocalin family protein [Pseudomonadota bacterium]
MIKRLLIGFYTLLNAACTTTETLPPLTKVPAVDLSRFMGDWYVLANIPTFLETGAHNAIEHYDLNPDGSIAISFSFHKDSFEGPKKNYTMTGTVVEGTNNAEWRVSPFWPIKFPYYTVDLAGDYSWVVVATPNRDYLWIMARKPFLPDSLLSDLIKGMVSRGFKESEIQRVPQQTNR